MYVPKSEPCVLCMTRMCLDPATWYSVLELEVMLRMLPSLYHMTRGLGSPRHHAGQLGLKPTATLQCVLLS